MQTHYRIPRLRMRTEAPVHAWQIQPLAQWNPPFTQEPLMMMADQLAS